MKSRLLVLLAACVLLAMAPMAQAGSSKVSFSGGDGSSFEKAIIIHGATEQTGVDAEYDYLAKHFPGYHRGGQALTSHGKRTYDVLDFTTTDGKKMSIYFDITEFFGKF